MVTTIIPTLGRDTLWTRALPSVLAQPWSRCIIVGDGVTIRCDDERVTVLRIKRPRYPKDPLGHWRIGGVRAFNHGLDRVETEWFSYLADDDAYLPGHHRALLRARSGADVVYGQARRAGTPAVYGLDWPPRWDDIVQGSYIMRTDTGMRASETPGAMAWDRAWWEEAFRRNLRFARVSAEVMRYHPAPHQLAHHGG